ncbi:transcriptional regulator [Providencia heimbachae]|uniref:CII family transcriptional regulator n=1 Tax=Providencia heimbachae TaxID=333962 RepID=UPI001419C9DF|nr:CII family transcriptional regulator [Providencia heimbachae]NIH23417.1 transcriptional regulator [Providencia heimbachae]
MDYASNSKFREIETKIMKGILVTGAREVAKRAGMHESQVSRMQYPQDKANLSFVQRCARLLAAIEYDKSDDTVIIQGDEARALIQMLEYVRYPKRKTSKAATDEAQMELI